MNEFMPDVFGEAFRQSIIDGFRSYDEFVFGPQESRRKGHVERMPDAEWDRLRTARRLKFNKWRKLTKELENDGTLTHDHCYECGGELVLNKDRPAEWVDDETEEEWRARVPEPYKPPMITFSRKTIKIPRETNG